MARARKASDDVYNARRRLLRQAARIERDAAKMENTRLREASRAYAQSLRDVANKARGKMSAEQRTKALETLGNVRERTREAAYSRDATIRSNLIFAQQINAAGTDGASTTLNKNAVKAFWVANKGLWTDGGSVPRNERYARILSHWYGGTRDAQRLEDWIVSQRERQLGRKLTDEERKRLLARIRNSLQVVFEFVEDRLEEDEPGLTSEPEIDYERVKKAVYVAH